MVHGLKVKLPYFHAHAWLFFSAVEFHCHVAALGVLAELVNAFRTVLTERNTEKSQHLDARFPVIFAISSLCGYATQAWP